MEMNPVRTCAKTYITTYWAIGRSPNGTVVENDTDFAKYEIATQYTSIYNQFFCHAMNLTTILGIKNY